MSNRAWVTLATNDSYGLGALVLAHSLRRAGSAYPTVVMITPSVTDAMRERLLAVFAEVIVVDVLDSRDAAHLALLQRPELGITFTKLHCWSLVQYDKCVFLDADTLVVQNCDELFDREELSAAPDVGWPDCFNSGVFVFKPSKETFDAIIKFAQERGSFDGGDQGLLNSFFSDWAHKDISKHLPFLYNVTSAAFYSYLPALQHFGHNMKIIHFIGAAKPWLHSFDWETRSVDAPGHLQGTLQLWWELFVTTVHPQLDTTMTGVAGNLARVSPGSTGYQRDAIDDLARRQRWEAGNIDYMGADSFDNIWAKICETMSKPSPSSNAPPKEPSPPKEVPKEVVPPVEAQPVEAQPVEAQPVVESVQPKAPVAVEKAAASEVPTPVVEAPVSEVKAPVVEAVPTTEVAATPIAEVPLAVEVPAPDCIKTEAPTPVSEVEAKPVEKEVVPEVKACEVKEAPKTEATPVVKQIAVTPEAGGRKPAGKLQLFTPTVADPLPTPDSELEDAASLAQRIIASELATPTITPATPSVPTTPATPTTPSTPAPPTTTATPPTPSTPTTTVSPSKPATPPTPPTSTKPASPPTPATPTTPVSPSKPATPPMLTTPTTPPTPSTPVTPTTPVTPLKPVTPSTPATPTTPATSSKPASPPTPATPTTPVSPSKPATPPMPTTPTTPPTPSTPVTPTTPVTPPTPATPTTPLTPATPETPTTPVTSSKPATPPTPATPTTPVTPASPPAKEKSVEESAPATPPLVSLAQIGVKVKPTTAEQIAASVAKEPDTPTTETKEPAPKKKIVKKVVKKVESTSAEGPVAPPRKKEKKPKE